MKSLKRESPADAGFQIAPMIDVVFVIMLFFMVMAGAVKVEYELKTSLPGRAETAQSVEMPDEVMLGVTENGTITLNEDPIAQPNDETLEELYRQMAQMEKASQQAKTKLLVTVQAAETALYNRVVNVLDTLARAEVTHITFTVANQAE